jgi:hypothetical protein
MTKYIKQPKGSYYCGPIGIMNVLKWAECNITVKNDFKKIKELCRYRKGYGVYPQDISQVLKEFGQHVKFLRKKRVKIKEVDDQLVKDKFVLMLTSYWEKGGRLGHYWAISKKIDGQYLVHNVSASECGRFHSSVLWPRSEVIYLLRRSIKSHDDPQAWFISRR